MRLFLELLCPSSPIRCKCRFGSSHLWSQPECRVLGSNDFAIRHKSALEATMWSSVPLLANLTAAIAQSATAGPVGFDSCDTWPFARISVLSPEHPGCLPGPSEIFGAATGVNEMRIASTASCLPTTMHPRKPAIVLLVHDLKVLMDLLARVTKTLHRH